MADMYSSHIKSENTDVNCTVIYLGPCNRYQLDIAYIS